MFVYIFVRLTCHHPPPNPFLLSFYYPTFSTIQAVFGVFAILFLSYFSLLFL
nr:MAG TPA: hypothetical protein [Caudoviricetes sp.]